MIVLYLAVTAFVYVDILTAEGMIFGKLHDWCVAKFPAWIHKPLISCAYCFGGQIALWYSPKLELWTVFRISLVIGFIHGLKLLNRVAQREPNPTEQVSIYLYEGSLHHTTIGRHGNKSRLSRNRRR